MSCIKTFNLYVTRFLTDKDVQQTFMSLRQGFIEESKKHMLNLSKSRNKLTHQPSSGSTPLK